LNVIKQRILFKLGKSLKIIAIVLGVSIIITWGSILLLDGLAGSTKHYPRGMSDGNFLLNFMASAIIPIVAYLIGRYLQQNNEGLE
jgi:hypothetical protein